MAIKAGWTGRVFEDFEVGDIYEHSLGRTVITADNVWFTLLTMNTNPIHFDCVRCNTEFKRPLVNSSFTLALVTGQSVTDSSMNAVANLGWDEVRLPHPVFEGDTSTRGARCSRRGSLRLARTSASCASRRRDSTRTGRWSLNSNAPLWCQAWSGPQDQSDPSARAEVTHQVCSLRLFNAHSRICPLHASPP